MKKLFAVVLLGGCFLPLTNSAIDLKQAKFTQVVNNVDVISQSTKGRHPAAVNDVFLMPDVLRTGPNSRAELVAPDNTITRVGANTVFSFDPANRTIDLQQGSILFHSPHGKGGGTIHTGSATASVLGTTIIVTTTPNGGFKVLVLEGQAEIRFLNGMHIALTPGQMTFVLPGGGTSPVVVFRLDQQTQGSQLVNGFVNPLPSMPDILAEVTRQLNLILNNLATDTGLGVGNNASPTTIQVTEPDQTALGLLPPPSSFLNNASVIGSDKTVNQTLPVNYSPLDPGHVVSSPFTPPTVPSFTEGLQFLGIVNPVTGGSPASGFVGNNIDIDTQNIDLSSFAGNPDFDFMATGDLRIWQSVDFTPGPKPDTDRPAEPDTISLFAGGRMLIAPGSTLEADTGTFGLVADSFGTLDTYDGSVDVSGTIRDVSIYNTIGDVDILSLSDLTILGANSDDTIYAGGSVDIQSDGTLNLGAAESISQLDGVNDVYIDAGGNVDLTAGLDSCGDLNVVNSEIYAGDSSTGGEMNLNAGGNIYLSGDDIEAYSGDTEAANVVNGNGDVTIGAPGSVDVEDTYIYGDGDVSIESGGELTVDTEGSETIEAGGSVYLTSDYSDVNIYNYDIYADYGGVNINAYNGNVTLNDDYVFAYGGESSSTGYINVYANGNVDFTYSDVYQDNSVTVTANNGHVNIYDVYNYDFNENGGDDNSSDTYLTDWTITAGCYVDIGADEEVQIYNNEIYAGGHVDITSGNDVGGDIKISDSDIYAGYDDNYEEPSYSGGSIKITAYGGNVCLYDDDIEAYAGENGDGNVCITAGGGVTIKEYTDIYADGNVNITSEGTIDDVTLDSISAGENIDIKHSDIYAGYDGYYGESSYNGGSVNINAYNGNVCLYDDDIEAYSGGSSSDYGNVNIYGAGTTDLEGTYINADGDVSIESGDTLTLGNYSGDEIDAGGSVYLTSDNADVDVYDYSIYADGGDVDITANNGSIDLEGNYDIEASGEVSIQGAYEVYLDNNDISADAGDVDITSQSSSVDVENTYINAHGDVNIHSYDTLSLGWNSSASDDNEIDAGGNVDLTSYDGKVKVGNYDIYADGGDITVNAVNGGIKIEDSDLEANNNVTLNAGDCGVSLCYTDLNADNGDIDITATGDGGIYTYGNYCDGYISAYGSVTMTAGGDITINDTPVSATTGYSRDGGGSSYSQDQVSISSGGQLTINGTYGDNNYDYDIGADSKVILWGENGVSLDDAYVTTLDGCDYNKIEITSDGNICIMDGSELYSDGSVNVESDYGNVSIVGGSEIYANAGNVCITADDGMVKVNAGREDFADDEYDISAGRNVTLDGDCIEIKAAAIMADCSINVTGENGNVLVNDTDLEAFYGDVNVAANYGDLTMEAGCADYGIYIDAGGAVNLSADGNVTITSSGSEANTIFAGGGDVTIQSGGAISIKGDGSTYGNVDVENMSIQADGSVYVKAYGGDINMDYDPIVAEGNSDCGDVDITAYCGAVDLEDTTINAAGNVDIEAGGMLTVNAGHDYSADDQVADISAGGYVTLDGNCVTIKDTEIGSSGTVTITGEDGNVKVEDANIQTSGSGDVDITANYGNLTMKSGSADYGILINAAGAVNLSADGDICITSTGTEANQIYANGGDITIQAGGAISSTSDGSESGSVRVNGMDIESLGNNGDVTITAYCGTADLENTFISAAGNVSIESGDTLTLGNTSGDLIDAGGTVSLTSDYGDVDVKDSIIGADSNIGGDVDITALNGAIDLENSGIYANGNVIVESGDTLTLGDSLGDTIQAGLGVSLTSDYGDVDIYGSSITANGGDVDITSGGADVPSKAYYDSDNGDIDIEGVTINATPAPVGATITPGTDGDVNINAGGGVTLANDSITAGGAVYVEADNYDVDISSSSSLASISGNTGVTITSDYGAVNITDTGITSSGGDVNINAANALSIEEDGSAHTISGNNVYLTATGGQGISISGADIAANNGDVVIQAENNNTGSLSLGHGARVAPSDLGGTVSLSENYISLPGAGSSIVTPLAPVSTSTILGTPDIDLEYGSLEQSDSMSLDAPDWVYLNDFSVTSDDGDVVVAGDAGYVEIDNSSSINANGGSATITAGDYIDVEDSSVYANDEVDIDSFNGSTYLSDDYIYADNGDVNIVSYNSTVELEDTYINAGGDVNINSGGSTGYMLLGVGDFLSDGGYADSNNGIDAYGSVYLTSDGCGVLIADYTIGDNNSIGGDVAISAPNGLVALANTQINAYGDVCITGGGSSGGFLNLGGDVILGLADYVFGYEDGYFSDYYANNEIYAGGSVTLQSANADVLVYGYSIYAYGDSDAGNVGIYACNGQVDLEDSYISANGCVDIMSGDTLTLGDYSGNGIDAGGSVTLESTGSDVDIYDSSIGYNWSIGGGVNIYAYNGSIDMENTYLEANCDVNIESGANVYLYQDGGEGGGIYSDCGNVNITSDGTVYESPIGSVCGIDIECSDIEASCSVNITADNDNNVYAYGDSITADYGDVNINTSCSSSEGTIDLEDTYIVAAGDVNITSGGTLTLGNEGTYNNEIEAGGNICLTSAYGDVDISGDYDINANDGNVGIIACDGYVSISGYSTITSDENSDVSVSDDVITANNGTSSTGSVEISGSGGDVYIYGNDGVGIYCTTIDLGGNVCISGSSLSATGVGDVDISTSGGSLEIDGECVKLGAVDFSGNNISVSSGSTITTADGNVNINNYGTFTMNWDSYAKINDDSTISLGNVDVSDSTITANGGDVNISTEGSVSLACIDSSSEVAVDDINISGSTINAYSASAISIVAVSTTGNVNLTAGGNVYITDGSTIYADNDVNISATGQESGTSDYGNVDIENSSISAGGTVNVTANGYVYDYGSTLDLVNWDVTAGTYVELGADGDVTVNNSSLTASGGDVDIYGDNEISIGYQGYNDTAGTGGTVDVSGTTISATGDVNIYGGAGVYNGSDYGYNDVSGTGTGGSVDISAGGTVGSSISASGDVDIYGGDGIDISYEGSNYAAGTGGSVDISSSGTVGSSISASGDVTIDGGVGVNLDSDYSYNYGGGIGIGGDADISGSTVSASGDVDIYGGDGIYIGYEGYNYGAGTGGSVDISASGTVGSSISASGDVTISGGVGVNLNSDYSYNYGGGTGIGGGVGISGSSVSADGDVDIYGGDGVDVGFEAYNYAAGTGGNVNITSGSTITADGSVYIYGGNGVNVIGNGAFTDAAGNGGTVTVSDSAITATDVDIYGGYGILAGGSGDSISGAVTGGDVDITLGSTISASGDVNINTYQDGAVDIDASSMTAGGSVNITSVGTLTTGDSSTITATSGNVGLYSTVGDINANTTTINATSSGGTVYAYSDNGAVSLGGDSITADTAVNVNAATGITVNGGSITADDTSYGQVNLTSTTGVTTIQGGASVKVYTLSVNSPDGILLDGTSGGTLKGNTMNLTASSTLGTGTGVTVQSEDLSQLANVNITAHTVNLDNDNFASGSSYNFTVFNHDYFINNPNGNQPGSANFNNDTLNGAPIVNQGTSTLHNQANNGGIVLGGTGAGIHIN